VVKTILSTAFVLQEFYNDFTPVRHLGAKKHNPVNMKSKIILCLALVLSGVLFGCSTTARHHVERVGVSEIKITFAKRQVAPAGDLPHNAKYPPGFDSHVYGPLTSIVADRISALTVTWADAKIFRTQSQTQDFLRELLNSTNGLNGKFHVWSQADGVPHVVATVEHTNGRQGNWWIWVWSSSNFAWTYLDGDGVWWWGHWDNWKGPKLKSLETEGKP